MRKKGFIYTVFSAIIFSLMPLMTKRVYSLGLNSTEAIFYRMFLSLLPILLINIFYYRIDMKLSFEEFLDLAFCGVCFGASGACIFKSYTYINSGTATAIYFLYPILVFIGECFANKRKPSRFEFFALIGALTGLALSSDFKEVNNFKGVLYAFMGALAFAKYAIEMGKDHLSKVNNLKVLFYVNLFASFFLFLYINISWGKIYLDFSPGNFFSLFLYSFAITLGAAYYYQKGLRFIGPTDSSMIMTLEILMVTLIGMIFLKEQFSLMQIFSSILIFVSCLTIVWLGGKR